MISLTKRFLQNFFGLSRTETNGFLIFLPFTLLLIFSEPIYAWWIERRPRDSSADKATLDSLAAQWEAQQSVRTETTSQKKNIGPKRFPFDPNTATAEELTALGFPSSLASRLIHYREKGGKFKIKSDVMKIFGMRDELYQNLAAYIQLPDKPEVTPVRNTETPSFVKKELTKFDLNNADTTQLKSIYGIGTKLSERIVKYRQRLGGFVTLNQLTEVYGLDSLVINRLTERAFIGKDFLPVQIDINKATEKELSAHPYLTKAASSAIAAYRFQHGNFREVNDLRTLRVLREETIEKISPYLKFE